MKKPETDSKLKFQKNSGKKKKINYLVFQSTRRRKNIDQIEARLRYWQNNITIGNADQRECISLSTHKDKAPLWKAKNQCPTIFSIWKTIL